MATGPKRLALALVSRFALPLAMALALACSSRASEPAPGGDFFVIGSGDGHAALRVEGKPLALVRPPEPDLVAQFSKGPMASVEHLIFAARTLGEDPHWYANFGYTLDHSRWKTYGHGGRLCRLDLKTGKAAVLLEDRQGGVRDPAVHYDGRTILFSYRRGDEPHYHLWTMRADGSDLRQLTDGPYDDIEPAWLPDGDIVFVSTRCSRRVNCHTTQSAVLYRGDADGKNLRPLSSNNEPDNTPWVLPSGQVLYTRWVCVLQSVLAIAVRDDTLQKMQDSDVEYEFRARTAAPVDRSVSC